MKKILWPTDFSDNAENALPWAIDIAKRCKSKLFVLHVFQYPSPPPMDIFAGDITVSPLVIEELKVQAEDRLKKELTFHDLEDIDHSILTVEGNAENEIVKLSSEENIDLIVMGNQGKTAKHFLFGNTTKKVLQNSTCPVLAIPQYNVTRSISNIVYASDLKYEEANILKKLITLASLFNAHLSVLHIDGEKATKAQNLQQLESIAQSFDYRHFDFIEIIASNVTQGIISHIEEHAPDILAMTTYNTTILEQVFHRSTTMQILKNVHIPLLVFSRKKYDTVFLG